MAELSKESLAVGRQGGVVGGVVSGVPGAIIGGLSSGSASDEEVAQVALTIATLEEDAPPFVIPFWSRGATNGWANLNADEQLRIRADARNWLALLRDFTEAAGPEPEGLKSS